MIASFLKRERERTVNIFHYLFLGVHDRSAFLQRPFKDQKSSQTVMKRWSGNLNGLKRLQNHVQTSKTKESLYFSYCFD